MNDLMTETQRQEWAVSFGEQWARPGVMSDAELGEVQDAAILELYALQPKGWHTLNEYTCHRCSSRRVCALSYDLYNTLGDCLLEH